MQAIRIQQVLALLVALDTALRAPHPLSGDTPKKALALVAVGRRRGSPCDEFVRRGRGDRVDHRLQRFLVHVHLLRGAVSLHRQVSTNATKWISDRGKVGYILFICKDHSNDRLSTRFAAPSKFDGFSFFGGSDDENFSKCTLLLIDFKYYR